jgi:hypothetical protein
MSAAPTFAASPLLATPVIPEIVAERLTELEAFCLRTGRRPIYGATEPQEASLAAWVHRIRQRRAWRSFIDEVIHPHQIHNPDKPEQLRVLCRDHAHHLAKRSADQVDAALARGISEAKYLVTPVPALLYPLQSYPHRSYLGGPFA